ncbi:hypothetical protein JCM8547_008853 [Rhodosporidiobolus lusitaniae]
MSSNTGLYYSYAALLCGALFPIWTGSRASLIMPREAKRKLRELRGEKRTKQQEEEDEEDEVIDRMTREDAYLFPLIGSAVLFSLFLAFKYLPKEWVNRILGGYMAVMAVAGLARSGTKAVRWVVGENRWGKLDKYKISLTKNGAPEGHYTFTSLHLYALPLAAVLSGAQMWTRNWILSNIAALSFAFNAVSLLYLDSFVTGALLLSGLFSYDIWWVFGSKAVFGKGADVMVSVATSFEAPIKLLAPKDIRKAVDFSLLGLGDIVLPGIFIALARRFDYHLALSRSTTPITPSSRYPKPYFTTCFVAYIAGLVTTMVVMHYFRAAQPALLYLSPACILSVAAVAAVKGEWKALWAYEDGDKKEDEKKERVKEKKEQ